MYKTDSIYELENDIIQTNKKNSYLGVKLVRGAYYQEDKNKKLLNNQFVLHQNKVDTVTKKSQKSQVIFFKNIYLKLML